MSAVLAIASAPLYATEIDDLVNTSQSIRDTFAYGIKTIAGGSSYAWDGNIAPAMAENGHITTEQQNAYNAAVAAVAAATYTYDPGADEYFQDQADQAMGFRDKQDEVARRPVGSSIKSDGICPGKKFHSLEDAYPYCLRAGQPGDYNGS